MSRRERLPLSLFPAAGGVIICLLLLAVRVPRQEAEPRRTLPTPNKEPASRRAIAAGHLPRSANAPADDHRGRKPANPSPLPKLTPELQTALHQLVTFAQTGKVADAKRLGSDHLRSLADAVAHSADTGSLLSSLAYSFGMPQSLIPTDPAKMSDFLVGWFHVVVGYPPQPAQAPAATSGVSYLPAPIAFTDRTDQQGQVTSSADAFVSTTDTLYGVFENQGSSAGTSYVTAVWRNNDGGTVVHQGTESVFEGSPSNYVWLRLPQGWSPGQWQLDIYDPANNFTPIASGIFTIK